MYTSPSGKKYVGQTWGEENRKRSHKYFNKSKTIFSNAIRKYGYDNIKYEVLHYGVETQDELNKLECIYIELHNTIYPNGYNMKHGGSNGKLLEETRYKISKITKELWNNEDYRNRNIESKHLMYTEEYRKKISEKSKSKCNDEYKEIFKKRMNDFWSKTENRIKHSEKEKIKWSNPDFRNKMSESRQRINTTEQFRIKSSLVQKRFIVKCIETGIVYRSARMAAEQNNTNASGIMRCCKG